MLFNQQKFENPHNLDPARLWLIATSAPLAQLNKERSDTLLPYGDLKTTEIVKDISDCLKRDWSISTKKGLLKTIKDLPSLKTFTAVQENWSCLSQLELEGILKLKKLSPDEKNTFKMIDLYQFSIGERGDLAWHYGRIAWLIRCSVLIGLIDEDEAWALLDENGQKIKVAFSNWVDFGTSYTIGAQYWLRASLTEIRIKDFTNVLMFLLGSKDSPWMHVEWPLDKKI